VFHTVPQDSKYGSGVPMQLHVQRLEAVGRQPQRGHRIAPNESSRSTNGFVVMT
jgi:hypothetical protein